MSSNENKESDFLTIKEAAEHLGLPSVALLRKWMYAREITFYRWGARSIRFKRSELDAFKKKRQVPALV